MIQPHQKVELLPTSVTAESIYTRDPEEAISDQEKLAAEELRRQRIKRARENNLT